METRARGGITECTIAVVQVEDVRAEIGQDEIWVAIVVDVADSHSMVETVKADPGAFRDVFECAV